MFFSLLFSWSTGGKERVINRRVPTAVLLVSQETHLLFLLLQGRGSGFPGRRRPRGAGLSSRAGRGRARGKNGANASINPGVRAVSCMSCEILHVFGKYQTSCKTVLVFASSRRHD